MQERRCVVEARDTANTFSKQKHVFVDWVFSFFSSCSQQNAGVQLLPTSWQSPASTRPSLLPNGSPAMELPLCALPFPKQEQWCARASFCSSSSRYKLKSLLHSCVSAPFHFSSCCFSSLPVLDSYHFLVFAPL